MPCFDLQAWPQNLQAAFLGTSKSIDTSLASTRRTFSAHTGFDIVSSHVAHRVANAAGMA